MAKIKLGAIVTEIRGKLGGHVFSKNRGGAYMRTKTTPVNPQSIAQSAVRAIFGLIASAWSALSDVNRTSYRTKVNQYVGTDIFGDVRVPSGKALHQKLNQNLLLTGQAQQSTCPNAKEVADSGFNAANYDLGADQFDLEFSGNTVGSKLLIFATPQLSQGTKFVKNKLRMLGSVSGVNALPVDVTALYLARFGQPVSGDNIVIAVKVINDNGQASPMLSIKATVG